MESLESLRVRKKQLENELESITIKKHGSTPWASGVQDQYKSNSFSYNEYTDLNKAHDLKNQIEYLDYQIKTYGERVRAEEERQEAIRESRIPKYEYAAGKEVKTTKNPAIAARYDAQHRLFGMSKLQQTYMAITGQKRKFEKLWVKATTTNKKVQEEVAEELNGLFR